MAYTARELVNRAYFLSGIVGRGLQEVSGQQFTDGMYMLNALLALKTADTRLIPFFSSETIDLEIGVEGYFIENLVMVESVTFELNNVRFPLQYTSRKQYFNTGRVNGIESLPAMYHPEREKGGTRIYVYYLPNEAYPLTIWGKFGLMDVTEDTDLEDTYEQNYIEYLRYALAQYICAENGTVFSPSKQKILDSYEELLTDISPMDLTVTKRSLISGNGGNYSANYTQVNAMILGGGWFP